MNVTDGRKVLARIPLDEQYTLLVFDDNTIALQPRQRDQQDLSQAKCLYAALQRHIAERALIRDYYTAAQIGREANTEYKVQNHRELMDALMQRTMKFLDLEPHEEIECECGITVVWLIGFFGYDYQGSHINDCPECGQHTLHVSDESQRCVNCKRSSGWMQRAIVLSTAKSYQMVVRALIS